MSAPNPFGSGIYLQECFCVACVALRASTGHSRVTCPACPHLVHAGDCDACMCHYEPSEVVMP